MGGPGSGSFPDDGSTHRGGRKKKAAVAVTGSGLPVKPRGLSKDESKCWDDLNQQVSGIAFEQDSDALTELACLTVRQRAYLKAIRKDLLNSDLNRESLAIGRAIVPLRGKFGLTPRDRQLLLVPREEAEKDELEKLMEGMHN